MTTSTAQKRATAGGEYGANGEWYEGGKFINTVEKNGKKHKEANKATRKQNTYPNVWEVPAEKGARALFPMLSGIEIPNRDYSNFQFAFNPDLRGEFAKAEYIATRKARIAAFNAGTRWI